MSGAGTDTSHHETRAVRARGTSVPLFGLSFDVAEPASLLRAVERAPATEPRMIVTANVDHVVTLAEDAEFRAAYAWAAARTLDGMPLVWLARRRGHAAATRITGHDLLAAALASPTATAGRIFLVCASREVERGILSTLARRGFRRERLESVVPPFGFERDEAYSRLLAHAIRTHGTTLLIFGVGAPKSETWVYRHRDAIGAPLVLCAGEAVSVAGGIVRRAPPFLQKVGLEWLFRLGLAPRRLFYRYFVRSWRFFAVAYTDVLGHPTAMRDEATTR
jgi:N-acetylglucosaminyldiphosphoundecaprenol N-acetyl-beta-D-mannosaminyltransferase